MQKTHTRSIYQQVKHAVDHPKIAKQGQSKRAAKASGTYRDTDVYSQKRREELLSTARGFSTWYKATYGKNAMVRDIASDQVQRYIDEKVQRGDWRSQRTVKGRISAFGKISAICGTVYGTAPEWTLRAPERQLPEKLRDKAMTREDYEKLRAVYRDNERLSRGAQVALELDGRCGLRVAEAAGVYKESIDTQNWVLRVREGAKNGRFRDVPIRPRDRAYFASLRDLTPSGSHVCGIGARAISKSLTAAMRTVDIGGGKTLKDRYPREAGHAIRKMYARERMGELRAQGYGEAHAWDVVAAELGHGAGRTDLYKTYVGGTL